MAEAANWSCRGAQLFGAWAIEPEKFAAMVNVVRSRGMEAISASRAAAQPPLPPPYVMRGGVALVPLSGPLTKHETSFQSIFGGTSTLRTRRALRQAQADDAVSAIMLRIDSPGGTVDGVADLVDDVRSVAATKPVWAYIEDLGASAAYWIAAAADRIIANRTALVGSIGVFATLEDSSAAADLAGIKVHVVRTGPHKGAGVPGVPIGQDDISDAQRVVDGIFRSFSADVQAGRELAGDKLDAVSTGQVWIASEAKRLGLVDSIGTFEDTVNKLGRAKPRRVGAAAAAATGVVSMHQTEDTVPTLAPAAARPSAEGPATIKALKEALPNADAEFREECLMAGLTLTQATSMHASRVAKENAQLKAKLAETEAKLAETQAAQAATPQRRSGAAPVPTSASTTGPISAKERVRALVDERVAAGEKRHEAHAKVMRQHPDLREALVAESNA